MTSKFFQHGPENIGYRLCSPPLTLVPKPKHLN